MDWLYRLHRDLALELMKIGCIKFGSFKLKLHEKNPDAPLSPIYIDLRLLRSYPTTRAKAVDAFRNMLECQEFDLIADVPTAATPIVSILAHEMRVPMITPRNDNKGYGSMNKIDGVFRPDQTVVLIDDLITKADSKLEAIKTLEEHRLKVKVVVVLVDREQGGEQQLKSLKGISCLTVFTLTDLIDLYLAAGQISPDEHEKVVSYMRSQKIQDAEQGSSGIG